MKNQATHKAFSGFSRLGVLALGALLMLPTASVHARAFSYLGDRGVKADITAKVEPQNSQTITFLEAAIHSDPNPAKGGGDITVVDDSALLPDVGPAGTIADIESGDRQGKVSLYVVRQGDTLPQIAKMFGVSTNTILWANDLKKGVALRAGQSLVILPVDGVQHTVQKGETLKGIAKKYKGDIDEIIEFNDLAQNQKLAVGDVIVIPNGSETMDSTSSVKAPASSRSRMIAQYPAYNGYYAHPVPLGHKTQGVHGYNGVDYGAPVGTPVYAAAEGVVVVSNFRTLSNPWFGGYGNYVVIEHPNGTQTLYGHLSAVYVKVGARLDKGQILGEVGNTGKSSGPHLHFEVRGAKNPF